MIEGTELIMKITTATMVTEGVVAHHMTDTILTTMAGE